MKAYYVGEYDILAVDYEHARAVGIYEVDPSYVQAAAWHLGIHSIELIHFCEWADDPYEIAEKYEFDPETIERMEVPTTLVDAFFDAA